MTSQQDTDRQHSEFQDEEAEAHFQTYLNLGRDMPTQSGQISPPAENNTLTSSPLGMGPRAQGTQSQTVQGDSNALSDSYDSNLENINRERKANINSKSRKKQRRAAPGFSTSGRNPVTLRKPEKKPRYSLVIDDDDNFQIWDVSNPEGVLTLSCNNDTFQTSVLQQPSLWIDGIRENMTQMLQLRTDNRELEDHQATITTELRRYESKCNALQEDLQRSNADVTRLRSRRDAYQAENIALTSEVRELRKQVSTRGNAAIEDYDSDDGNPARQRQDPVTRTTVDTLVATSTMKARDTPMFSGDGDRDSYEAWKMSILSKIRNNPGYFTNEWRIIDYIRESVSGTAFNIIKARCDPEGTYPYTQHKETLRDLDGSFAVHDLVGQSYAKLGSREMRMGYNNPKETFEEYYGRFLSCIGPLQLEDRHKIEILKSNLTERLAERTSGLAGTNNMNFTLFCNNLKATDIDFRLSDQRRAEGASQVRGSRANRTADAPPSWSKMWRKDTQYSAPKETKETTRVMVKKRMGPALPPHISRQIRNEGRCYNCLGTTHIASDPDAPCKGTPPLTNREMVAKLSAIDIDWDGEDYVATAAEEEDPNDEKSDSEN